MKKEIAISLFIATPAQIYTSVLKAGETIMLASWPAAGECYGEAASMEEMMEAVRAIRNMRAEMNVPAGKKATIIIRTDKADVVNATCEYMKKLAHTFLLRVTRNRIHFDKGRPYKPRLRR